jgi:hypothetical protein
MSGSRPLFGHQRKARLCRRLIDAVDKVGGAIGLVPLAAAGLS